MIVKSYFVYEKRKQGDKYSTQHVADKKKYKRYHNKTTS